MSLWIIHSNDGIIRNIPMIIQMNTELECSSNKNRRTVREQNPISRKENPNKAHTAGGHGRTQQYSVEATMSGKHTTIRHTTPMIIKNNAK